MITDRWVEATDEALLLDVPALLAARPGEILLLYQSLAVVGRAGLCDLAPTAFPLFGMTSGRRTILLDLGRFEITPPQAGSWYGRGRVAWADACQAWRRFWGLPPSC